MSCGNRAPAVSELRGGVAADGEWGLASLHYASYDPSNRSEMYTKIFGNLTVTVSTCRVGGHGTRISPTGMGHECCQRRRGWAALGLWNGQAIPHHFRPSLHALDKGLVAQVNLLA